MATGKVKWFNTAKGFGFIQPDDGGQDIFVHVSAVERAGLSQLDEGQTVNYELEQDSRSGKTAAGNLEVTGSAPPGERSARAPRPAASAAVTAAATETVAAAAVTVAVAADTAAAVDAVAVAATATGIAAAAASAAVAVAVPVRAPGAARAR